MNFAHDTKRRCPAAMNFRGKTMNSQRMTGNFSAVANVFLRGTVGFLRVGNGIQGHWDDRPLHHGAGPTTSLQSVAKPARNTSTNTNYTLKMNVLFALI